MSWPLALAELVLLTLLWRGPGSLFPAFWFYMVFALATQVLFAVGAYNVHLWGQVMMAPLKLWAAWEAIALRFRYLDEAKSERLRLAKYWIVGAGVGVAIIILIALTRLDVQFNEPPALGRARNLTQAGIAIVLGIACGYSLLNKLPSPLRAKPHLWLLFVWFLIGMSNMIGIRSEADEGKWWMINWAAQWARLAVVGGWWWIFRFAPKIG